MNMAPSAVAIEKIETLDAESGAVIGTLDGDGLAKMMRLNGGGKGTELAGGRLGLRVHGRDARQGRRRPEGLAPSFRYRRGEGSRARRARAIATPHLSRAEQIDLRDRSACRRARRRRRRAAAQRSTLGGRAADAARPIATIAAPRSRSTGRCASPSASPSTSCSSTTRTSLISGPIDQLSSYAYFGDEIYSVADGTVVGIEDGLPEQVPGKLPEDATIQMAAGNHVVVDIGEGRFAFYAHMQPGSVRVKVGDRVKTGQVLGLLGNSGNTDTPHLHFHVMDGPSPLRIEWPPLRVQRLHRRGPTRRRAAIVHRRRGDDRQGRSARTSRERAYPLIDQVVSFP